MLLPLLAGLLQAPAADYPRQRPIAPPGIESCRSPEYTDDQYRAMASVAEIEEARARFPGSHLFVPSAPGPHPGIVMLHGSGGGRYTPGWMCVARHYASWGYATLAFCYFDCGDDRIPEALADVDLRRTYDALV